jgi:superfamily I DNA/RNA helicase
MVWLPNRLNLSAYRYDILLGDEVQDWNACQQGLARKLGKRLVLCGDDRQAIYGFAGADSESMPRMRNVLEGDGGCQALPLTVTRRCGKRIVAEARRTVPDFEAHPDNPEGTIRNAKYPIQYDANGDPYELEPSKTYLPLVAEGDMVICRCNAPLVSQCFRLIKMGLRATIQGRDVGRGLKSLIDKLDPGKGLVDLLQAVRDWRYKEVEKELDKQNPDESKVQKIEDRADCISFLAEGEDTVAGLVGNIDRAFTDNRDEPGVRLSSIHKAKGLEARRVFFLMPRGAACPHPSAKLPWQVVQEKNLLYVGQTRPMEELVYVT